MSPDAQATQDDPADEQAQTVLLRADLGRVLATLPLFAGLEPEPAAALASAAEWLSLPGGATLFEAGDASDALYIVLHGALEVHAAGGTLLRRVPAGGTVGEMGVISGRPRTASVRALRDTELARIAADALRQIFAQHPEALLCIARLLVERLEGAQSGAAPVTRAARTFTLLPQNLEVDVAGFAMQLVKALGRHGRTELVWSVRAGAHTSHWFHQIESANDFVVYVGEPDAGRWSRLCVRQADALLLLARAESEPRGWPALGAQAGLSATSGALARRAELVLLHDGRIAAGAAARWLAAHPGLPHHHVADEEDMARVARLLTGRAVGVVFSGGGARGFAHIGIVKALREAGIPLDLIGGTSMGAILGAGVARGWSVTELTERLHAAFVAARPLRDYTLPLVSLVSGQKVTRLLRNGFGEGTIEDLPLGFFCVSSNLTTGHHEVHRRGPVWRALRASVAIPGVLPPVVDHGAVLVDGGTMNNLPVDVMRELGRGPVIGCDVGADRAFTIATEELDVPRPWQLLRWAREPRHRPNIFQVLWRAGMVNSNATTAAHREKTDLLLQPPLAQIDMLNWRAFDRAIAAGYEYAVGRIEALPPDSPLRQR